MQEILNHFEAPFCESLLYIPFNFAPRYAQYIFPSLPTQNASPFLLVAIPGGGKTVSALTAARNWMAAGSDRRVIVVVPTSNLKDQWKTEAVDFGIQLQTDEFGTNFKHGFQGCAVTYAGVASSPLVFRKLCAVSPVLVAVKSPL